MNNINNRIVLGRNLTRDECPWLDRDLKKGDVVYRFLKTTYQCINTENGIACSYEPGEHPFFEIPLDAIDHIGPDV
jgi:hypothetical protein